ncbi:MAG: arylformamidase [Gammaproteobacteria bacterium]|jgi:arylformamidase
MIKKRIFALLLVAVAALGLLSSSYADKSEYLHAHVGGGLSHPPFSFFRTTWYRDIVYDNSTVDTSQTSLDIYVNDPVEAASPVMVWVHGGGNMAGDKAHSKELDPKPEFFTVKMGYVFVSANYRLMPEGRYPHGVQDLANALAWVQDNIADFGGDPEQIYLMGHSAGANMVAEVATHENFLKQAGKDLSLLKGVILVDGNTYDLKAANINPRLTAYYGNDWKNAQPVSHVARGKHIPPFLLLHVAGGSNLGTNTAQQAISMASALQSMDIRADVVALDHVEHFGANERIGEPGDVTTRAVEQFLLSLEGKKRTPQWIHAQPPPPPK